jgi:putative endonuclease
MCYVYVLKSQKDKRFYVGSANNIELRLKDHNQGRVKSTKNRSPFMLFYKEKFANRQEARQREMFVKNMKSSRFIEKLSKGLIK